MNTNSRLRALLEQPPARTKVPHDYELFVGRGFHSIDGCLLFRELSDDVVDATHVGDATGFEARVNSHHITDYLDPDHPRDAVTLAHVTLACARRVAAKLRAISETRCRVIFSIREGDATLRFHRVRDDESPWLAADLEGYLEEAVGYIDSR